MRYLTWAIFAVIMVLGVGLMASGPREADLHARSRRRLHDGQHHAAANDAVLAHGASRRAARRRAPRARAGNRGRRRRGSQHRHDVARRGALVEPVDRRKLDPGLCRPDAAGNAPATCARSEVTERLEELLGEVPDADEISFSLSGSDSPSIEMALMGENKEDLEAAVEELKARLLQFGDVTSVRDSQDAANEELRFTLLPGAEQLGITLARRDAPGAPSLFRRRSAAPAARRRRRARLCPLSARRPAHAGKPRRFPRAHRGRPRSAAGLGGDVGVRAGRHRPRPPPAHELDPGDGRSRQRRSAHRDHAARSTTSSGPSFEARYSTVSRRAIGEAEGKQEFLTQLCAARCCWRSPAIYFLLAVTFRSYCAAGR